MLNSISLETSFTFVQTNALRSLERPQITDETFGNPNEHFVLSDVAIAEDLHRLAMKEMAIGKVAVGSAEQFEAVEFFYVDVRRDKATLSQLRNLISKHWLRLVYELEVSRNELAGDILSDQLTGKAAAVAAQPLR